MLGEAGHLRLPSPPEARRKSPGFAEDDVGESFEVRRVQIELSDDPVH